MKKGLLLGLLVLPLLSHAEILPSSLTINFRLNNIRPTSQCGGRNGYVLTIDKTTPNCFFSDARNTQVAVLGQNATINQDNIPITFNVTTTNDTTMPYTFSCYIQSGDLRAFPNCEGTLQCSNIQSLKNGATVPDNSCQLVGGNNSTAKLEMHRLAEVIAMSFLGSREVS